MSAVPAGSDAAGDDGAELDGYRSLLECLAAVPEPRCDTGSVAARLLARRGRSLLALAKAHCAAESEDYQDRQRRQPARLLKNLK